MARMFETRGFHPAIDLAYLAKTFLTGYQYPPTIHYRWQSFLFYTIVWIHTWAIGLFTELNVSFADKVGVYVVYNV